MARNYKHIGWRVFFKTDSEHNTAGASSLSLNNFHAELGAIEYALSIAHIFHNHTIFTDSLSSIQLLQFKKVPQNQVEADFVLCISNLLEARSKDFQGVNFYHVYSHLNSKLKKASFLKKAVIKNRWRI